MPSQRTRTQAGTALRPIDHLEIQKLFATYSRIVADGEFEQLREIFWPEIVQTIETSEGTMVRQDGVDELIEFIGARQVPEWRGKHILSIPVIGPADPPPTGLRSSAPAGRTWASAMTEVVFINRTGPERSLRVATMGRYNDLLQRAENRWKILRRTINQF